MIDLGKIQKEIYQNKVDKGFNITDINKEFCLTYGEVSEAYEAWRKKKDDLGEELADIAIYLLGLSEILKIDLEDEILKKVYKNSKREYKIIDGVNTRVKEYEKNNIYLATKLFSFYDRYASTNMYVAILKSKKYENANIYLPFRDSNMKVSNIGNVSKNIFDADINSLKDTDVFICRIDGLSFDAGIGFELGYCLAKESLLYVFSTDFVRTKIFERKFTITNIVDKVANSFYYEYKDNAILSYEDNLKENINEFTKFVTNKTDKYDFKFKNKHISNKQYDVFIDFCGQKYQWNKLLLNSIVTELEKNGITYWISDRYKTDYDFEKDISALDNCKIYLTCFDENEPDFDSCILQGYAYYKNKNIIGYESNNITYFVEGGQSMGVNLMVEQSCNRILKSYTEIVKKIVELKNEKEK